MKNIISKTPAILTISVCLLIYSCKKNDSGNFPVDPVPINLTSAQLALIESGNAFAFDVFRATVENSASGENVIISPLSISTALSMAVNGAAGPTRDSMLKALRVKNITTDEINNSFSKLSKDLLSVDKRVNISISNSVWAEKNFVVKKPFTDILTEFYNAESKSFDIKDPLAPKEMNNWIAGKTNGLIKEMIDKLDDNTVMMLINAIYFKGKWKSQFDVSKTDNQPFYKTGGAVSQVPMMKQTSDFRVYTGSSFTMAEFPYGQGNFVMDVIIPLNKIGVDGIVTQLNDGNFRTWIGQMSESEIVLSFPRFKYGYKTNLNNILSGMGMGIAFSGAADFSNISELDLLISTVLHQAFIETNEEGTEAAAATVIGIGVTSIPNRVELSLDHPFIYIIRETSTNSILFMGKIEDPLAK